MKLNQLLFAISAASFLLASQSAFGEEYTLVGIRETGPG